jgi:hypothetical protein
MFIVALVSLMKTRLFIWRSLRSCKILRDLGCRSLIPRMRMTHIRRAVSGT